MTDNLVAESPTRVSINLSTHYFRSSHGLPDIEPLSSSIKIICFCPVLGLSLFPSNDACLLSDADLDNEASFFKDADLDSEAAFFKDGWDFRDF